MATFRIQKSRDYFYASNLPFRDVGLSWAAKGVLAYLLSRPNDWIVRSHDLENQYQGHGGGVSAVKRIVKELKQAGYMDRVRTHTDDGRFSWETHVFERSQNPDRVYSTMGRFSTDGKAIDGKPTHILKTDLQKTDLQNEEGKMAAAAGHLPSSNGTAAAAAPPPEMKKRYRLLKAAGVGAQKMVELLNADHTTYEYLQAHLSNRGETSMGLLITKMLDGDPVPDELEADPVPAAYRDIVKR